jgi:hypothetical protein
VRGVPARDVVQGARQREASAALGRRQGALDRCGEGVAVARRIVRPDQLDVLARGEQRLDREVDVQLRVERPERVGRAAEHRDAIEAAGVALREQQRDRRAQRLAGGDRPLRRADVGLEPVQQRDLVVQRGLHLVADPALLQLRGRERVAVLEQPRLALGAVRRPVAEPDAEGREALGNVAVAVQQQRAVPALGHLGAERRAVDPLTGGIPKLIGGGRETRADLALRISFTSR